ncbi:MAG: hypothetical protein ACE5LU_13925 [Anaerolineae bacterium]
MSEPIDARIQELVATLNQLPGITTFGSCGGHPNPGPRQWPEGTCYVKFTASEAGGGLVSVQFLSWVLRDLRRQGVPWRLVGLRPPADVEAPPDELFFALEGYWGTDPDQLAEVLELQRGQVLGRLPAS